MTASHKSLEGTIADVSAAGFRINNLFQLDTGEWRANLTDGVDFWEFGKGASPAEALTNALKAPYAKAVRSKRKSEMPADITQELDLLA